MHRLYVTPVRTDANLDRQLEAVGLSAQKSAGDADVARTGACLRGNPRVKIALTFAAAVKTAGVPTMTPHGLWQVYAGLAVQSGASVKTLQSVVGHASAAMTLDRYAGLFAADVDAVADRLDQAATESVGVLWVKAPKSSSK
jgi:integrase